MLPSTLISNNGVIYNHLAIYRLCQIWFSFQAKRLAVMEAKLNDGSLNNPVETGLIKLAASIRDSNFDEAEKIQVLHFSLLLLLGPQTSVRFDGGASFQIQK